MTYAVFEWLQIAPVGWSILGCVTLAFISNYLREKRSSVHIAWAGCAILIVLVGAFILGINGPIKTFPGISSALLIVAIFSVVSLMAIGAFTNDNLSRSYLAWVVSCVTAFNSLPLITAAYKFSAT